MAFACVRTAGFYGNYLSPMLSYMKQPDGSFVWSNNCGDDKYAWHAVEDIGQTTAGTDCYRLSPLSFSWFFLFPLAKSHAACLQIPLLFLARAVICLSCPSALVHCISCDTACPP